MRHLRRKALYLSLTRVLYDGIDAKVAFIRIEKGIFKMEKLMTIDQVAELLQVPTSWIYERTRSNKIPHRKVGTYLRFEAKEIHRWLDSQSSLKFRKP